MGQRPGGVFTGHISGVTEWGLYVEIDETHCEGLVGIRGLDDDFYEFDEKNYCIRGRRRGRVYRLGDPITIQVARADLIKKQLDFVIVDDENPANSHRIDREPITEQNSRSMSGRLSRDERQRMQYEGGSASRHQQRGARGNSTRRQAKEARGAKAGRGGRAGKPSRSGKPRGRKR